MKNFYKGAKILATVALAADHLYYAFTQPGPMDLVNGAVAGLIIYAIWFARERTK